MSNNQQSLLGVLPLKLVAVAIAVIYNEITRGLQMAASQIEQYSLWLSISWFRLKQFFDPLLGQADTDHSLKFY